MITNIEHARVIVKAAEAKLNAVLSYDEALTLYKDVSQFAEDCGPFDPAYEYFISQRDMLIGYMNAIDIVNDLQRIDHLDFYKVMISGKKSGEIDTLEIGVPKHSHLTGVKKEHFINTIVKSYARKLYVANGLTKLMVMEDIDEIIEVK